ncbi:MAG TPA: hypothetical protein VL240_08000 [Candidatus Binatia bacterium]|nr:hypothetical protein [Candidatus Binatia bacterium]
MCAVFRLFSIAAMLLMGGLVALPLPAQELLYSNGPDGDSGYYHVNFGSVAANSFVLSRAATVTNVVLTLYDVDDRNVPQYLKWTITTEPFGGRVEGSGFVPLSRLQQPYLTRFLFFAWEMGFTLPAITLPAGTHYLQIQDVVTQWDTWAFWAQSANGGSQGYYESIGPNGAGTIGQVSSETFSVSGQWLPEEVP